MMITVLIFITLSVDSEWILLGENCCWSLLGLKGLTSARQRRYLCSRLIKDFTGNAFRVSLQHNWRIYNGFLNRPIAARTQILVHSYGPRTRFSLPFRTRR